MPKKWVDEDKKFETICHGMCNVLWHCPLSWRDKAILMLCAYDSRFHSQKAIQSMGKDGSCSVRNAIHNLVKEGYLIRKEVFTTDECGNKIGEWQNLLSKKAADLLFPNIED